MVAGACAGEVSLPSEGEDPGGSSRLLWPALTKRFSLPWVLKHGDHGAYHICEYRGVQTKAFDGSGHPSRVGSGHGTVTRPEP